MTVHCECSSRAGSRGRRCNDASLQQPVQPECQATDSIVLVTLAGNEYHMPANLEHYEDFEQLEDDVVNFLPSVANIDVFGCEIDLIRPDTRLPLRDPIQATLRRLDKFQVVVKPCIEVGHNIWQFQDDNRQGYPKAVRVPLNDMGEVSDRAFYSAPMLRHVEVAQGRVAAWQSCHQLQIVKLPPSVICLKDGAFQGCYALFQITAPGCAQIGRRAFAECCSLSKVGVGKNANNALAPGAQIAPFAFESCLALTTMEFDMSNDANSRALPEGLRLPPDLNFIGPMACENCKRLIEVDLMRTDICAIWGSTFSYCVALVDVWLPLRSGELARKPSTAVPRSEKSLSRQDFTIWPEPSVAASSSRFLPSWMILQHGGVSMQRIMLS